LDKQTLPLSTTLSRFGAPIVWLSIRTVLNDQPIPTQGVSPRMRTIRAAARNMPAILLEVQFPYFSSFVFELLVLATMKIRF
jgi:hypothetical protein